MAAQKGMAEQKGMDEQKGMAEQKGMPSECKVEGCNRQSWNGKANEKCCRTCGTDICKTCGTPWYGWPPRHGAECNARTATEYDVGRAAKRVKTEQDEE